MRPFRFRLARVRDWQAKVCTAEEEKFRSALAAVSENENSLARLRAEATSVEAELACATTLGVAELQGWAGFRRGILEREGALLRERAEAQAAVEQRRSELIAARRRLELMNKIGERELVAYRAAADREYEEVAQESQAAAQHRQRQAPE